MHLLPNISRSKDNQIMKFGQWIEYNMNIFVEKSYAICGRETIARSLAEKAKLRTSLVNSVKF